MKILYGAAFAAILILSLYVVVEAQDEGVVRTYYIAADEVVWDYVPSGKNAMNGLPLSEQPPLWAQGRPYLLGSKFKKAIYREYTDATFSTLKPRAPKWEHLGMLGPMIRAEVGDTIKIVFRNNAKFPASMHPHGVFYAKSSEGALYKDGTEGKDKEDDGVPTGGTYTYTWEVPARAGPSATSGLSSAVWSYHSHVNERKDVNAGLMGAMIITAKGKGRADLSPRDVDREFVVDFMGILETTSWYIEENIQTYMAEPDEARLVPSLGGTPVLLTPQGRNVEIRETMNGYLYGNLPLMTMKRGERVRWYVMAGTNFDLHAPHWHGNTVETAGINTDVLTTVTMSMQIADMDADNPGVWIFHCHIAGHMEQGMLAMYEVLP